MQQTGNIVCDGISAFFYLFLIPGIFTLISVAFLWALAVFTFVGDYDEEARGRAKALIIWCILIFLAMVILWALFAWLFESPFYAGLCHLVGRI